MKGDSRGKSFGPSSASLQSYSSKVCNVLICVIAHLFQRLQQLIIEYICVNVLPLCMDYFANTEFHIWNVIFCSSDKDWNYMLCYLVFCNVWHHSSQWVQATHSIVVTFLINCVVLGDCCYIFAHYPVLLEALC